ncbi:hypothetical protein HYFRA_00008986 [Hymenoscyphus fraxineus]|uniref:Uncharacterized protein n=1 Tax=Hymenoscyphus fraxineus TaxID=746836 RepID=A0A9N9KVG0_9HELO|nr:hypothetical protein HYFRA_00008986 [Hymenoscyphus fraxineus]
MNHQAASSMKFERQPRQNRPGWTEIEDRLLYYWMQHSKSNNLTSKAIGLELQKEVDYLKFFNADLNLPNPPRDYTANSVKNRIKKIEDQKLIFHPLRPQNPDHYVVINELNGLGGMFGPDAPWNPEHNAMISEADDFGASFKVDAPGVRVHESAFLDAQFGVLVPKESQVNQLQEERQYEEGQDGVPLQYEGAPRYEQGPGYEEAPKYVVPRYEGSRYGEAYQYDQPTQYEGAHQYEEAPQYRGWNPYEEAVRQTLKESQSIQNSEEPLLLEDETLSFETSATSAPKGVEDGYDANAALRPIRQFLGIPEDVYMNKSRGNPQPSTENGNEGVAKDGNDTPRALSLKEALGKVRAVTETLRLEKEIRWSDDTPERSPWKEYPDL